MKGTALQKSSPQAALTCFWRGNILLPMEAALLEDLLAKNKPFRIEIASGRVFDVPHRDFLSFSPKKTSVFISYEEEGNEHFAIVPLLTVMAAMARA